MTVIYDLRGVLRLLDERLTECSVAELIEYWRPLIRICNGDLLSVSIEDVQPAGARLRCDEAYNAVIWPFTQAGGIGVQAYYGTDFFTLFPKGERFRLCSPLNNVQAVFDVEGYIDRAAAGRWTPRRA